jgi:Fe-S-cluster containining protein
MLSKKTFKCERCSSCCKKYIIKLYGDDIKRIRKRYSVDSFMDKLEIGPINDRILRKVNGACVFLKKNSCEIYSIRPKICKQYPFFSKNVESCKPVTMESLIRK